MAEETAKRQLAVDEIPLNSRKAFGQATECNTELCSPRLMMRLFLAACDSFFIGGLLHWASALALVAGLSYLGAWPWRARRQGEAHLHTAVQEMDSYFMSPTSLWQPRFVHRQFHWKTEDGSDDNVHS